MATLHLTNPLTKGSHVREAQERLKNHHYFKGTVDGVFGPATGRACHRAKYDLGYRKKDIKPTYGDPLDGLLKGTIKLPLAYRIRQKSRRRAARRRQTTEAQTRNKIVAYAKWLIAHRSSCTYQQLRPIDGERHRYKLPLHIDCSGYVTDCYSWAGAPDPNGEGYNGLGYTGTLLEHMHHITVEEVEPGDIAVAGYYPGRHAFIALESGANGNPLVGSMGHQGDPNEYHANDFSRIGHITWLKLPQWAK